MGAVLGKALCICPACGRTMILRSPSLSAKINSLDDKSFTYKDGVVKLSDGTIVHKCGK